VAGAASLAPASPHTARWIPVPPVRDPAFADRIRQVLDAGSFLTVLPSSDAALLALGAPVEHLVDKSKLAESAARAGLEVPPGVLFESTEDLRAALGDLPYPVVVKPAAKDGRWQHAAYRADRPDQVLLSEQRFAPVVVQAYVPEPIRSVAGIVRGDRVVAAIHQRYERTWPADCGTASAAVTVEPDESVEARVPGLLAPYEGLFQLQFAGRFLLDVNPRPYGSLPLSVAAGVNLPAMWCDLISGRARAGDGVVRARPGVRYRWLEGDLRNLRQSMSDGSLSAWAAVAAVAPRAGSAHSTESLRDLGPSIARLRYAVQRARTAAS
jgi:hypothetical protein